MKPWLTIVATVGLFGLGLVTGALLENRAKAQLYRSAVLTLGTNPAREALLQMNLLAEGRTDALYELAEGKALFCASAIKPEHQTPDMRSCAFGLKAFYEKYPRYKAMLRLQRPDDAATLGLGASP